MINFTEIKWKIKAQLLGFHPKLRYRVFLLPPNDIKKKNEKYLLDRGARICEWLPWTGHVIKTRISNEISKRAATCQGLFNIYLGGPTDFIKIWLTDNNLIGSLTESELKILVKKNEELEERDLIRLGWNIESLYALMWAGSIVDELEPEGHVPDTLVNLVPNVEKNESADTFIKQFKLRPYEELYKMLDLYYRAHWYVRDCYWSGGEDSKNFDFGVIQSRREALEWIFDIHSEWDNVDLST